MDRYPHKIIIQKVITDSDPYKRPVYETIFTGRCRCFLKNQTSPFEDEITTNNYQVVIPYPKMVDVGENFKVGVKFHNTSKDKMWDLLGYVKDFARFDRVCNLFFQEIKDLQIQEDKPQ